MASTQRDVATLLGATVVGISYDGARLSVVSDEHGVVHVVGEIDAFSAPSLRAALEPFSTPTSHLVLDLSEVTFIGSAGVTELIRLRDRLRGRLEIRSPSRLVWRVLVAAGVVTQLGVASPREARVRRAS